MGWLSGISNSIVKLTEYERSTIYQLFGSFHANRFALNPSNYLKKGYEENVDVFSIINKIRDASLHVEYIIEQKQKDGSWEKIEDTELHALMDEPNKAKGLTWNDINLMLDTYYLATGNSYLLGTNAIGFKGIQELDVLPANLTRIKSNKNWLMPEMKYIFEIDNTEYTFEKDEVSHLKFFNPHYKTTNGSLYGLSPIQVAAMVVQTGNDRWEADANLMQNKGAIGLVTDRSDRPMQPADADKIQGEFDRRTTGLDKFGKVIVTNKNLDFVQMAMSPSDLQILEKGVVNLRTLCNIWGLDSSLFNDPANKTYNNRLEAEKALYTNAVMPLIEKKLVHFNRFITKKFYPDGKIRMNVDYTQIECLQEDQHKKSQTIALLKNSGIISANTAARELGKPESEDPNADKLQISNSTTFLENLNPQNNVQDQNTEGN